MGEVAGLVGAAVEAAQHAWPVLAAAPVAAIWKMRIVRASAWNLRLRAAGVSARERKALLLDAARKDLGP